MKKAIILMLALNFAIVGNAQKIVFDKPNPTIYLNEGETTLQMSFHLEQVKSGVKYQLALAAAVAPADLALLTYELKNSVIDGSYPYGEVDVKLRQNPNIIIPLGVKRADYHPSTTFVFAGTITSVAPAAAVVTPLSGSELSITIKNLVPPSSADVTAIIGAFDKELNQVLDKYDPAKTKDYVAVQSSVLDAGLNLVFANVIFGSNGSVQNGTAAAIASDKDKGTASVTVTAPQKIKWLGNAHFNSTIAAAASNGIFNLFTDKKFYTSASGGIGLTWLRPSGQDKPNAVAAADTHKKRKAYAAQMLQNFITNILRDQTEKQLEISDAEADINKYKVDLLAGKQITVQLNDLTSRLNRLEAQLDSIKTVEDIITRPSGKLKSKEAEEYIQSQLAAFDMDNNLLTGYHISWWDAKATFTNYAFSIANDSLPKALRDSLTIKNTFDMQFSLSYNRSASTKNSLWFFNFTTTGERASYLNNSGLGLTGKPYVLHDSTSGKYNVLLSDDDGNKVLGEYKDIHHECWYISPSVYFALFFGKSKFFGFQAQADYHQPLTCIPGVYQPSSFNIQLGPVIRIANEADASKATIGLKAGFVNAIPNTHVWKESFGVKLEVGVPFKWYEKKEKKADD